MELLPPHNQEIVRPDRSVGPAASGNGARLDPPVRDSRSESGSVTLLTYWRLLLRRKGTLIVVSFLGLLASILLTLPQPPVYQTRASLEIQDINDNFLNMKRLSPVSDNAYSALGDIQTQIKILQSGSLNQRATAKLRSTRQATAPSEDTSRWAAWRKALNLPGASVAGAMPSARTTVRATTGTRIIEIVTESTDPRFAADYTNTLANEFIDSNLQARWDMSQHTAEWLSRQLQDMRIKLERSEDELQAYARKTGLMFAGEKGTVSDERLRALQASLASAQAERISVQSRSEMATADSADAARDVAVLPGAETYNSIEVKLTELRQQESELLAVYTEKHEKVTKVRSQIAALEASRKKERARILARVSNDYEAALRREHLLANEYADQSALVTEEAGKSIQYGILKREVDSNRQLYDSMLEQLKQSTISSAMRANNARVVDSAGVPGKPFKPDYGQNAAFGAVAGLCLGIAFVLVREKANRALQEPGDLQFWLKIVELGVIPNASARGSSGYYYSRKQRPPENSGVLSAEPTVGAQRPYSVELITLSRDTSIVAEAFRTLLTSILYAGHDGNTPRVLVLTSAGPSEGKSTVVSNLAIAFAGIQRKVLVIDADLRRPRMHSLFGLPNERGLSTLLRERSLLPEHLEGIVQTTSVPGLHILPSGPSTQAAVNLLYSTNMAVLVAKYRQEFDLVIIDTPPMLQMTDARVVGRLADGVILVVRAGKTTRDAAMAASQRFAEDKICVLGSILNDWNPKNSPGGYYGYYNGYYYGGSKYYRKSA